LGPGPSVALVVAALRDEAGGPVDEVGATGGAPAGRTDARGRR
jgi:hypothetical protein